MKTLAIIFGVLVGSLAPLSVHAAPIASTKPAVERNLEVQQRQHARRVHKTDHAGSPARSKLPGHVDGRVKAQPHLLDAR